DDVMTAGKEGKPFVLFIDPYPYALALGPKGVAEAIRWARRAGWSAESGPSRAVSMSNTEQFEWLPEGGRHLSCVGAAPLNA
ncbi:MAG TPA: hypothetical protein VIV60_21465, partial [Polyangiaceae bacterium]